MKQKLIAIGYWHSIYNIDLPDPSKFQDSNWNLQERAIVLEHLKNGKTLLSWMGISW